MCSISYTLYQHYYRDDGHSKYKSLNGSKLWKLISSMVGDFKILYKSQDIVQTACFEQPFSEFHNGDSDVALIDWKYKPKSLSVWYPLGASVSSSIFSVKGTTNHSALKTNKLCFRRVSRRTKSCLRLQTLTYSVLQIILVH